MLGRLDLAGILRSFLADPAAARPAAQALAATLAPRARQPGGRARARDSSEAVYGVGGGITWSSNAEAEHAEVVAKTAVLHHRHEDFELLETMRYSPDRGLRNRDRHLRRLADSAEYWGFRFDPSTITEALSTRLVGCGPSRASGSACVATGPSPSTWATCRPRRRAWSPSR